MIQSATSNRAPSAATLAEEQVRLYHEQGYLIVKGLFRAQQVAELRRLFDDIAQGPAIPGHFEPKPDAPTNDPSARYPRVLHPHRFNDYAKQMMLHPSVHWALQQLFGDEPVACQSMYYYKPPGARGQALHQDNFYLEVEPQTCLAAWTAIDPARPDNGGMYIVPKTDKLEISCPESADLKDSFTTHLVNVPKGMKAVPAIMEPGDTLFFNGSVIHGSGPNRHASLWRRSFICHYMPQSSRCVSKWYFPIHDFAGREIPFAASTSGGPCGVEDKPSSYDRVH